jgi:hypothetical protein
MPCVGFGSGFLKTGSISFFLIERQSSCHYVKKTFVFDRLRRSFFVPLVPSKASITSDVNELVLLN